MAQDQKLELGRQIWDLLRAGHDRVQVLRKLGISIRQFEDSLREFQSQLSVDVGRAMEHYRNLDNERIEEVIQALMPIALDVPDRPEEVLAESKPISICDSKRAMPYWGASTHARKSSRLLVLKNVQCGRGVLRYWRGCSSSTRGAHERTTAD